MNDGALRHKSMLELEGASQSKIMAYEKRIDLSIAVRELGIELSGVETIEQIMGMMHDHGYTLNFEIVKHENLGQF